MAAAATTKTEDGTPLPSIIYATNIRYGYMSHVTSIQGEEAVSTLKVCAVAILTGDDCPWLV